MSETFYYRIVFSTRVEFKAIYEWNPSPYINTRYNILFWLVSISSTCLQLWQQTRNSDQNCGRYVAVQTLRWTLCFSYVDFYRLGVTYWCFSFFFFILSNSAEVMAVNLKKKKKNLWALYEKHWSMKTHRFMALHKVTKQTYGCSTKPLCFQDQLTKPVIDMLCAAMKTCQV